MSFFAGGGWRNATSAVAQATTTTDTVSASRPGSGEDSTPGETTARKPLLRSQTDPLLQLASQNSSQTSLAKANPDSTARRLNFRSVARAFLWANPAAIATAAASDEAQKDVVSSSPPQTIETIIDLSPKTPVRRSTVAQEVFSPPAESISTEHSESPVSDETSESVDSSAPRQVNGRKSTSSSTGSTIVTEETQTISQGLEDVLSDVKKSVSPVVNSESLQNRIAELEKENAEKTTQLEELEETTSREKAEFRRIHTNEMESHRREHQQSLEKVQRQAREAEEKADALQRQLQVLREEKQLLEKRRDELKAELLQTKDASEKAVSGLEHAQAITNATNTISTLQNELSTSTATIHQLRSALDSASHDADGLAETLEERAIQVQRLQHNVSDLEGANQALNEKVENLVSQMKTAEETAAGERAELCKKHTADIDAERHIGRNLQSSLESLQLEMGVTENKVTTLTREKNGLLEKVGKLEERCKNGQHQIAGLRTELTNANALVKDLEEKGKVAREDARKEKMALSNQVNLLRRQFEGAQKESGQRQDQIQRLEATKDDMTKELSRAQTSVSEKDAAIEELQQKNSVLEESRENLEERLVDMERTMVEARETAQSVLDEANRAHEREITRVRTRIQELQDELSSFITTAQQLHASLEVSHSDAQKAQQLAEERRDEIHRLQERVTALQDDVRSLEVKNDETISQMKSTEQAAREEKATILCSHAAEMQSQRTMVQTLKEGLELNLKEKEDELGLLVGEIGTLRTEVTTMKQRSRKDEVNIEAVQATLREVTERNKNSIERLEKEKVKVEEEAKTLTGRVLETLKELKACKAELDKLKNMTSFQKMADGFWYMFGASSSSAAAK